MTEILCVVCPVLRPKSAPRLPNTPQVCDPCRERLQTDLAAIGPAYADIDPAPVRGSSEILTRVFESKPPLNLNELSLIGPGTQTPRAVLDFWVVDWAGELDQSAPMAYVAVMANWLLARLDWACNLHPAVDDFARDVRQLAGELHVYQRAAERRGHDAGRCPRRRYDDGEACGTPLSCDPHVSRITCPRCGTSWDRDGGGWVKLRAAQLEREGEAA